jgi:hypothetical protein
VNSDPVPGDGGSALTVSGDWHLLAGHVLLPENVGKPVGCEALHQTTGFEAWRVCTAHFRCSHGESNR